MTDQRFISILNQVAASMTASPLDPSLHQSDTAAVQRWAEFLGKCVSRGVTVGDPRWKRLEVQRMGGRLRFRLPDAGDEPTEETRDDFSVGLALLMSVLDPEDTD